MDDSDEIKDLIKKKTKLYKDSHKQGELGDVLYQIGYLYYEKGYYKEALDEFENALEVRKKIGVNLDTASTHRFIGETLCKLGSDFERAKSELDRYYSITLRLNDLVEIQRALTTLGNYFMSLAECNYKNKRQDHLNDAYTHYLKSYDILNEISDKKLVDSKEFGLMKARTCLNCAFAMDEKRDLIICNEYLKTAIEICESNHFHEDLIRCLYIKCDQAKRKGKVEECLKVADRIVEITHKTKDYVQQSQDYAYVADLYAKVQNFEKAKILLKKAYKLRKHCAITPDICKKLKEIINIIRLECEINQLYSDLKECKENEPDSKQYERIYTSHEKLGDSYCNIGLYELGLNSYFKQLNFTQRLKKSNSEIAVIYSSIAQTYQDLDNYKDALKFFELELKTYSIDEESECKSLLNVALLKEKLQGDFIQLKDIYLRAYEKAKQINNLKLQLKVLNLLKETQICYGQNTDDTLSKLNALNEINRIRNGGGDGGGGESSNDSEENEDDEMPDDDNDENESLVFTSDSDDDADLQSDCLDEERKYSCRSNRLKNQAKKSIVKRNLRGETQLHVACIKGNFNLVKKLIEEGHPINERDNLNWLPIHEASNYGHAKIVDILIKHGAKINDSIGPITPLHDASQNGHFEVVRLLLNAGALSYVFSKDGYTPLDFLCKYKEDNQASLTQAELSLFKELYDKMLSSIRAKDKNYKIKRVVNTEDNIVIDETSLDSEESTRITKSTNNRSYKNRSKILNDLSDFDEDDSTNDTFDKKKKSKKAISEYRQAISNIGSKSNTCNSSINSFGKKIVDKVLVTESDYSLNDKWLINDLTKSNSNKRKYNIDDDDDEETSNSLKTDMDDDEDDFLDFKKNKKRLVDSTICSTSSTTLVSDESNLDSKKMDTGSSDLYESEDSNKQQQDISEITLISDEISNDSIIIPKKKEMSKHKTQLKLTKMQNYNIKQVAKTNDIFMQPQDKNLNEKLNSTTNVSNVQKPNQITQQQTTTWKIKAIIDNRNFLIPVSNINASVDELTSQILTRYKAIFSKDSNFKEPEKVLLKSSDDLILFGEDLIKDVLSDMCQVQVLIETYKSMPKLNEYYQDLCSKNEAYFYTNIKSLLKESEENLSLNLSDVFVESNDDLVKKQFDIIFESIRLSSKQDNYLKSLIKIDFSSNYLNDQILSSFFENILFECSNLKELNLAHNLLTLKTLKNLSEIKTSLKFNNLEIINLSDNDFGLTYSCGFTNSDLANYLTNLIRILPGLKELDLSECRINLENFSLNQIEKHRDQIAFKNLFSSFKNSQLRRINVSYNQFGYQNLTWFIENLPEYKIEYLNISNCVSNASGGNDSPESKEHSYFMVRALKLFFSYSITDLCLRNLNLNLEHTSDLLNSLSICKQLNRLDLSFNEFDPILIKYIFSECPRLEHVYLINNLKKSLDYETTWLDVVHGKFEDMSNLSLKNLEIKLHNQIEINEIKSLFKKRWYKNLVRIKFISKNLMEFYVV